MEIISLDDFVPLMRAYLAQYLEPFMELSLSQPSRVRFYSLSPPAVELKTKNDNSILELEGRSCWSQHEKHPRENQIQTWKELGIGHGSCA